MVRKGVLTAAAAADVYANAVDNPFLYDDHDTLLRNPGALTCEARHVARGDDRMRLPRVEVRAGASLRELLTEPPPSASARAPASLGRSGA
jgi:hypothetical protein